MFEDKSSTENKPNVKAHLIYPKEIEDVAKQIGFKAANLKFLHDLLNALQGDFEHESIEIKLAVPKFFPCSHKLIESHLSKYAPNWQGKFQEFKTSYQNQSNRTILEPKTIITLQSLQQCITNCFNQYPFNKEENELTELFECFTFQKQDNPLVMARSSGIHEDRADLANPGGNESLPATLANISKAIGTVAASYVGEKSLQQRLKAGEDITDMPVMPVLIQAFVGEDLNQSSSTSDAHIVSGVLYTNKGALRIQSAPGHGEYVVNSKGPADNFYISEEEIAYMEIRSKKYRLVPQFNATNNKISLNWATNRSESCNSSSLPKEALYALKKIANKIEHAYGMRMDIEFVYDSQNKRLNIVQARAIPPGARKNLIPSALASEYLVNPEYTSKTIEGLQVATPEINRATVITSLSQVIICKNIKEALDQYLKSEDSNAIKTVIVQDYTPDASHEAGQFNLSSIPVMQVADTVIVEKILQGNEPVLIIDPQHSNIYQLDARIKEKVEAGTLEDYLYKAQILKEGIFSSTLSALVSLNDYDFSVEPKSINRVGDTLTSFGNSKIKLGKLVHMAEGGDRKAVEVLLSTAYDAMSIEYPNSQDVSKEHFVNTLKANLIILQTPQIGEKSNVTHIALAKILRGISNLRKKGLISVELFKQIMITGSEMTIWLSRIEHPDFKNQEKSFSDGALLEYFNVQKKFEGSILSTQNQNVLNQSVLMELMEEKHRKKVAKMLLEESRKDNEEELEKKNEIQQDEKVKLGEKIQLKEKAQEKSKTQQKKGQSIEENNRQHLILSEILKLTNVPTLTKFRSKWQKFCLEICKDKESAKRLSAMVVELVKLDIHEPWFNLFFTTAYKRHQGEHQKILTDLSKDFIKVNLKSTKDNLRLLEELDAQIPKWEEVSNFDRLYIGLEGCLEQIDNFLKFQDNDSHLDAFVTIRTAKKFIDILDRTIKSLAYSRKYQDEEQGNILRAERYRKLVDIFKDRMMPLLPIAYPLEEKQIKDYKEGLQKAIVETNKKNHLQIKKSPAFEVSETMVVDNNQKSTVHRVDFSQCKSLEDCFSCIHQTFIATIDKIEMAQNLIVGKEHYPPLFAQFEEELMKMKGKPMTDKGSLCPVSNPINHLNRENPNIHYKLPLSIHNAIATVFILKSKDGIQDDVFLKFAEGSSCGEDYARWDKVQIRINFDILASNIRNIDILKCNRNSKFQHEPKYMYKADCAVMLSNENIPTVVKMIEHAVAGSFNYFAEDNNRFKKLDSMSDEQIERIHEEALSLIERGEMRMRNYYLDDNVIERIKILHKLVKLKKIDQWMLLTLDESSSSLGGKSEEEKIKDEKYQRVVNLIKRCQCSQGKKIDSSDKSKKESQNIEPFFFSLYTYELFDDKFCLELTGFNKNEFTKKFLTEVKEMESLRKQVTGTLLNIEGKNKNLNAIQAYIKGENPDSVSSKLSFKP